MATPLSKLRSQINESMRLIDTSATLATPNSDESLPEGNQPALATLFQANNSLLDRCEAVCETYANRKRKLRVIHHFACSGGSLISKCLAALPNVFLLSELHPHSRLHMLEGKPVYSPSDLVTLARYAGIPDMSTLEKTLFRQSVNQTFDHVEKNGGVLVLRDHTHADYCTAFSPCRKGSITQLLESSYEILHLVTVRHPLDSYLSLAENKWLHFKPASLDEYSRRLKIFVDSHDEANIFKYEDFVGSPDSYLMRMCNSLELEYSDTALDTFDIFPVTGDSGRKGNVIGPRPRKKIPSDCLADIETSFHYRNICEALGYDFGIVRKSEEVKR